MCAENCNTIQMYFLTLTVCKIIPFSKRQNRSRHKTLVIDTPIHSHQTEIVKLSQGIS